MREAVHNGKAADNICREDIPSLLAKPLQAVRARLNILPATHYDEAHEIMISVGIDPFNIAAAAA